MARLRAGGDCIRRQARTPTTALCHRDPEQLSPAPAVESANASRNPSYFALCKGTKPGSVVGQPLCPRPARLVTSNAPP